jgi:hypothetical protein
LLETVAGTTDCIGTASERNTDYTRNAGKFPSRLGSLRVLVNAAVEWRVAQPLAGLAVVTATEPGRFGSEMPALTPDRFRPRAK